MTPGASSLTFHADRAKTRRDVLYGGAESEISRFFLLCSLTGREIWAALDVPRSFRTVCMAFAQFTQF
jgi:hypothetical protein